MRLGGQTSESTVPSITIFGSPNINSSVRSPKLKRRPARYATAPGVTPSVPSQTLGRSNGNEGGVGQILCVGITPREGGPEL